MVTLSRWCRIVSHVAPLHPWICPTKPQSRIHVDFTGPFQGKYYLLGVDAHSKWLEIHEMQDNTTSHAIDVLRHLFSCYGLPEQLVSDNGPQFSTFVVFMKLNRIKQIHTLPYHPASRPRPLYTYVI